MNGQDIHERRSPELIATSIREVMRIIAAPITWTAMLDKLPGHYESKAVLKVIESMTDNGELQRELLPGQRCVYTAIEGAKPKPVRIAETAAPATTPKPAAKPQPRSPSAPPTQYVRVAEMVRRGLGDTEIAAELGIPKGTVAYQVSVARKKYNLLDDVPVGTRPAAVTLKKPKAERESERSKLAGSIYLSEATMAVEPAAPDVVAPKPSTTPEIATLRQALGRLRARLQPREIERLNVKIELLDDLANTIGEPFAEILREIRADLQTA